MTVVKSAGGRAVERWMDGPTMDYTIRRMTESDVPPVRTFLNETFRQMYTELTGSPTIGNNRDEGDRVIHRFHHPTAVCLVAEGGDGALLGVLFTVVLGTRSVTGPMAIRADVRSSGVGHALAAEALSIVQAAGVRVNDGCTPSGSLRHLRLHFSLGDPLFESGIMTRELGHIESPDPANGLTVESFSGEGSASEPLLSNARAISQRFYPGYDLSSEIRHVCGRGGGAIFVVSDEARPVGIAIVHFGPGSESFAAGSALIKFAHVEPGYPRGQAAFETLVHHIEYAVKGAGIEELTTMASTARRGTLEALLRRRYRMVAQFTEVRYPPVHDGASALDEGCLDKLHVEHPFALVELR